MDDELINMKKKQKKNKLVYKKTWLNYMWQAIPLRAKDGCMAAYTFTTTNEVYIQCSRSYTSTDIRENT